MRQAIADAKRRIETIVGEKQLLEQFIISAQKVCKHTYEDAPDLFNHHKREDYSRCSICGHVV